jgi:curli biogenesis system outer membrane secretion channel CsgG
MFLLFSAALSGQPATAKRRIAVFDFDNAAVRSAPAIPLFQTSTPNLGRAISELLINKLVNDGSYNVIERSAIDKVLSEQNFSNSDRTDPVTAARIGRVLGVDCIVLGSITEYTYDDKVTGSGRRSPLGNFGGSGLTLKHDISGRVQISARVVSTDTAEILAVSQGEGQVVGKGVKVDMRDNGRMVQAMTGTPGGTVMSGATEKAIEQLAIGLTQNIAKVPVARRTIDGKVADVSGERLILNIGSHLGVTPGDRVEVWRAGKPVRDPDTGKILRYDDHLIGTAVISSVDEVSAVAVYTGADPATVGDRVKVRNSAPVEASSGS